MAVVRRYVPLPLRLLTAVLSVVVALWGARLHGQGPDLQPQSLEPVPTQPSTPLPVAADVPRAAQENVVDIIIKGNHSISRDKVLANIGTRIGRPFDQAIFERDIRKLTAKNWFVHVHPLPRQTAVGGGVIITLEVVERPVVESIHFLGNKRVKKTKLAKEVGIKKGDPLDIYAVQDGQRKLENFYQSKAFNEAKISILEGNKPGDRRVVYMVHEGVVQKFSKVEFVGNSPSIAPDGRLKTIVQSRVPMFWFFKGQVDRKKIEEDVDKLVDYYRSYGFFAAHVGRDWEYNEAEDRVVLTFYIDEGPRYRVRNIAYIGNSVYAEEALSYNQKLKPGEYFDRNKMNNDVGMIKDLYGSHGYVFAEAVPEPTFQLEPGVLDLVYRVKEGDQHRIGDIDIQIKGDNAHTRYQTVLNRLSMRPGDIADIRQFRSSERRLKASGLYNTDPSKGEVPKIAFAHPDSEEGVANSSKKKRPSTAKRTGDPNSFRGQSPDDRPPPAQPPAPSGTAGVKVRGQSPDYGYGGRAVNPSSPAPQPYTVNQAAPPPATGQYAQQPSALPPAQPYGAAPPNYGAPQYAAPQNGQPYVAPAPQQPYGQAPPPPQQYTAPGGGPQYAPPAQPYAMPQGNPPGGVPVAPPSEFLSNPPPLAAPPLDVLITTSEGQTVKFMFGAGVNSNAGVVGSIVLDEQNFDWQRFPTSWEDFRSGRAFRGAGQKFRIEAAPGTQVSRYMANFTEPYLFDTPVGLNLSAYYFQRFYRDWTEQRAGGRASLLYQFTPDLSGNLQFRAEDIRISQPRITTVPDLNAVLGYTQLYSLKGSLAHDTRDNTFLATEGHYIEADFEYAVGSFQFPRFTANARQHVLLKERPDTSGRHTLSFYSTFGISGQDTPIYERFYAGGFGTLRGFQFRGASPQIDTVEVGGILEFINSIEYMFPLTADDMFRAVTFVDFGTVEYTQHIDWRNFRVAPGIGLRVTIPMISAAPIALDFAIPVQYAPNDIRQIFSFFVGVGH